MKLPRNKHEVRMLTVMSLTMQVLSRRKATGAFLEVEVRIREPLGGPQLHTVTAPWLILHPLSLPSMAAPKHMPQTSTGGEVNSRLVCVCFLSPFVFVIYL